jgi:hypothetical protein
MVLLKKEVCMFSDALVSTVKHFYKNVKVDLECRTITISENYFYIKIEKDMIVLYKINIEPKYIMGERSLEYILSRRHILTCKKINDVIDIPIFITEHFDCVVDAKEFKKHFLSLSNKMVYSIMTLSGKLNAEFYEYDEALQILNERQGNWKELYKDSPYKVTYKKGKLNGLLDIDTFINKCKPYVMYKIIYKNYSTNVIVKEFSAVEQEFKNVENEGLNKDEELTYEKILMSDFEYDLLKEFDGF